MHVFFEDDGQLKAGTVLTDNDSSLQIEAASGKRLKIKAAAILLRYAEPSPPLLIAEAQKAGARARSELPVGRVRRRRFRLHRSRARVFRPCAGAGRGGGRRHGARRRADVLLQAGQGQVPPRAAAGARGRARLGRAQEARGGADGRVGRRAARGPPAGRLPGEARHAALPAGQERDRMEDARRGIRHRTEEPGGAPGRVRRHSLDARLSLQRLSRAGVSAGRRVRGRTARRHRCPICRWPMFAHSRSTTRRTTEVDDAFSVRELPNGHYEVGVHIAAPALGIPRGSPLDALARARLSTVYMPGRKITMLPDDVVDAFTLAEGRSAPALSLYAEVAPDGTLLRHETRVDRVPVAANLRLDAIGESFAADLPGLVGSALDDGAARALEARATPVGGARQGGFRAHRLQLPCRLGQDDGRRRGRPRSHRSAPARQPARQAHRRAHDLRQQPVGQSCSPTRRSRASTGRRRTAR